MTHLKNENKMLSTTLTIISLLLLLTFMACSNLDSEIVRKGKTPAEVSNAGSASFSSSTAETSETAVTSSKSVSGEYAASATTASSSVKNYSRSANALDDDKRIELSFDEKNIEWKAYFEDDKLVELYKEGELVPESELSEYEEFIYKRYEEFTEDMAQLDIDMDELKVDLQQLKIDLSGLKDIKIDFDSEKFAFEMKKMKHELNKELAELKLFDSEEFALEMEEIKRELNNELAELKDFNFEMDFDFDELNKNLKNIKIDLSGLDESMASLEIELGEIKEELKVLELFLHDLKNGLVQDGYLETEDEDFELELTQTKMVVNDKRLPDTIHLKYLKLYKEHFGKDIDDDLTIFN